MCCAGPSVAPAKVRSLVTLVLGFVPWLLVSRQERLQKMKKEFDFLVEEKGKLEQAQSNPLLGNTTMELPEPSFS